MPFACYFCIFINVGLGEGAPAIGVPFFWPSVAMPNTVIPEWSHMVFLKFNGSTFSATTYPKLALVIPSLTLPDARGEFPRIWDDGRGVDAGRAIFSAQGDAIRNIVGSINALGAESGVFYHSRTPSTGSWVHWSADTATHDVMTYNFDASRVVPTASENRPRNIAFNFLVRAK
ncbi:TPA: tail fiber protein [Escherichia coli]|nr:tail fiber protein [Escherichia coli]